MRTFRLGDVTWERFGQACAEAGITRIEAIRLFIRWFIRTPGVELPPRPTAAEPDAK